MTKIDFFITPKIWSCVEENKLVFIKSYHEGLLFVLKITDENPLSPGAYLYTVYVFNSEQKQVQTFCLFQGANLEPYQYQCNLTPLEVVPAEAKNIRSRLHEWESEEKLEKIVLWHFADLIFEEKLNDWPLFSSFSPQGLSADHYVFSFLEDTSDADLILVDTVGKQEYKCHEFFFRRTCKKHFATKDSFKGAKENRILLPEYKFTPQTIQCFLEYVYFHCLGGKVYLRDVAALEYCQLAILGHYFELEEDFIKEALRCAYRQLQCGLYSTSKCPQIQADSVCELVEIFVNNPSIDFDTYVPQLKFQIFTYFACLLSAVGETEKWQDFQQQYLVPLQINHSEFFREMESTFLQVRPSLRWHLYPEKSG